jgi:hypothetical protein
VEKCADLRKTEGAGDWRVGAGEEEERRIRK